MPKPKQSDLEPKEADMVVTLSKESDLPPRSPLDLMFRIDQNQSKLRDTIKKMYSILEEKE